MLQRRRFQKIVFVNKETGFSVVMLLHYPTFPDFKDLMFLVQFLFLCQKYLQSEHNYINDNQEFLQFLNTRASCVLCVTKFIRSMTRSLQKWKN